MKKQMKKIQINYQADLSGIPNYYSSPAEELGYRRGYHQAIAETRRLIEGLDSKLSCVDLCLLLEALQEGARAIRYGDEESRLMFSVLLERAVLPAWRQATGRPPVIPEPPPPPIETVEDLMRIMRKAE